MPPGLSDHRRANGMNPSLTSERQQQVDELAAAFESRLANGEAINLDWALAQLAVSAESPSPEFAEKQLFGRLLATELLYRHRNGEHPSLVEYEEKYSKHLDLIRRAFASLERQPKSVLLPGD